MQVTEAQWMPISDAARELGVSIDTARRRIKRGELVAERRETPQGFTWWVCLAGAEMGTTATYADADLGNIPPRQHAELGSTPRRQSEAGHLADLVRELQGEVLRRTEAAATWQARAEFLAGQLEAARDEIKALAAPQSTLAGSGSAGTAEPTSEPPGPFNAPWWRRWRTWLAATLVVATLGSASCSASPSVKHAKLCGVAQMTFNDLARDAAAQPTYSESFWSTAKRAVDVAAKVC